MKQGKRILTWIAVLVLSLFLPGRPWGTTAAATEGIPIEKLLTTLSAAPVATMQVNEITAATSTPACYVTECAWFNVYGQAISGSFTQDAAAVRLRIDAAPGYYFTSSLQAYLNNEWVECAVGEGGRYVLLNRMYSPAVWAPAIHKHPGSETVEEGGWTSFVASASYVDSSYWRLIDAKGDAYKSESLSRVFSGVTVEESFGKIKLYGITRELDGAKISCVFTGPGGSIETKPAILTVNYEKEEESKPEETPEPERTQDPETPEEAAEPEEEEEDIHSHAFQGWQMDETEHWKACDCGETEERAVHSFQWTVIKEATKKEPGQKQGRCTVCGCMHREEIPAEAEQEDGRWKLYLAVTLLIGVLLFAVTAPSRTRKRRRKQKRRRY